MQYDISTVASNFKCTRTQLPYTGDAAVPLTSSDHGCPSLWIPCPSANPRAPGTPSQTLIG